MVRQSTSEIPCVLRFYPGEHGHHGEHGDHGDHGEDGKHGEEDRQVQDSVHGLITVRISFYVIYL